MQAERLRVSSRCAGRTDTTAHSPAARAVLLGGLHERLAHCLEIGLSDLLTPSLLGVLEGGGAQGLEHRLEAA